jgi:hypothetical protein
MANGEMGDTLLLSEIHHLTARLVQNVTGLACKPCARLRFALQQAPRAPTPRRASVQSPGIGGMPFVAQTLDGAQMASRDNHALAILGHDCCNVHLAEINTRGHDTREQGWVCDPGINGQGKAKAQVGPAVFGQRPVAVRLTDTGVDGDGDRPLTVSLNGAARCCLT